MTNYDDWFCSLSTKQKEHIAAKLAIKKGDNPKDALYPNCVIYWNELSEERKQQIHDHCTDKHGMWVQINEDWNVYSY